MTDVLVTIVKLAGLLFVVASMLSMGLSLTIPEITKPLKNVKLLILALVANFIVIPAVAYAIVSIMPRFTQFSEENGIAFILLATAAGAPFLPKLAQLAKGNVAYSVGLMTMLMVLSVFFVPIALPLLLPGVTVNPWDIAKSLIVTMLLPLGIGLFIKARWEETAQTLLPPSTRVSNVALALFMGVLLVMNVSTILGYVGTGVIAAGIAFYILAAAIGYFMAFGGSTDIKSVMSLGTGQRNLSAAFVVAAANFSHKPTVIVTLVIMVVINLLLLLPLASEMGKRVAEKRVAE